MELETGVGRGTCVVRIVIICRIGRLTNEGDARCWAAHLELVSFELSTF